MVNARCNGGGIRHALWPVNCFDGGMTDNTVVAHRDEARAALRERFPNLTQRVRKAIAET